MRDDAGGLLLDAIVVSTVVANLVAIPKLQYRCGAKGSCPSRGKIVGPDRHLVHVGKDGRDEAI